MMLALLAAPGCSGGRVAVAPASRSVAATEPAASAATPTPVADAPAPGADVPVEVAEPAAGAGPLDLQRVLSDTADIVAFGVRPVGGKAERAAADHIAVRLREMGYDVRVDTFPVPGGTSRNLIVRSQGTDPRTIVLGAHIDSKRTTPGANDAACGCAILLEVARHLAAVPSFATVEVVFFGGEEFNDGAPRDHHRGSRYHVKHMTTEERRRIAGMLSVDVVGWGPDLHARTMGIGPPAMKDLLLAEARRSGVRMSYLRDTGRTGMSDHEPYEKAGIPAVWLERLQDPAYHKMGDTTDHLQPGALRESGQLVLDLVRGMDAAKLDALARR